MAKEQYLGFTGGKKSLIHGILVAAIHTEYNARGWFKHSPPRCPVASH